MRDDRRLIPLMLVLAAFAVSAVAFPHLPASVPTHWGLSGQADHFGSRIQGTLLLPLVMLGFWAKFAFIPGNDRLRFIKYDFQDDDISTVHPEYDRILAIVLVLLLAIHVFGISSALNFVDVRRQPLLIAAIVSSGLIAIGNYLPRVTRRNVFIGVRVPWAYASEEVWRRTQRVGGYGLVAAGVVGLVGAVAVPMAPLTPLFVAMPVQAVIVLGYAYHLAHSRDVP